MNIVTRSGDASGAAFRDRPGDAFWAGVRLPGGRSSSGPHRYHSIDIMRAVAILLMVQVHFAEHLSGNFQFPKLLYDLSQLFGLVPAPFFTFVSGLSYSLWLTAQKRAGRSETEIVKYSFRRGMFLFVLGFAVNIAIWLPKQAFMWDILTLLGASALILTAVRKWHPGALIAVSVMIVLVSPPLRDLSNYDAHWPGDYFVYEFNLSDVTLGFLLNGYFPLLPWLAYALAGFAMGQYFYPRSDEEEPSLPFMVPLIGATLIGLGMIGIALEDSVPDWFARYYAEEWPEDFYPATTVFVLASLGGTVLCLWVLNRAIDLSRRITGSGPVLSFFRRYSQFALTVYVVHLAVHAWPMWIAATWERKDTVEFYVGSAVTTPMALALAAAFIVVAYPFLILLERYRKLSIEHLMRWSCD